MNCIKAHLEPFIAIVSFGHITAFVINMECLLSVFSNTSVCLGSNYAQIVEIQLSWQSDESLRPWNQASRMGLDRIKSFFSSLSDNGDEWEEFPCPLSSPEYYPNAMISIRSKSPIFQVYLVFTLIISKSTSEAIYSQPSNPLPLLNLKIQAQRKYYDYCWDEEVKYLLLCHWTRFVISLPFFSNVNHNEF